MLYNYQEFIFTRQSPVMDCISIVSLEYMSYIDCLPQLSYY